ncbi:hypothetical protein BGZ65_009146 [Modicella reniformis]|uniref:Peptidase M48 domain-containing protein n=1 Tax=Modicella reniformis TaxID=1440133 RepID=A0A9P6J8Z4_9FUNG|nr:hypothetical protein BGZ65_009146 [Modicella reniformis]
MLHPAEIKLLVNTPSLTRAPGRLLRRPSNVTTPLSKPTRSPQRRSDYCLVRALGDDFPFLPPIPVLGRRGFHTSYFNAFFKPMGKAYISAGASVRSAMTPPYSSQRFRIKYCVGYSLLSVAAVWSMGIFINLEQAPNTGRWRSTTEDKPYPELSDIQKYENERSIIEKYDIEEDPQDVHVRLVNHVYANMLEGLQDDRCTLKPYLCDMPSRDDQAKNERNDNAGCVVGSEKTNNRPPNIYVCKRRSPDAFTNDDGIFIYKGLLDLLENDEDMVAVVIGHEVAHSIQGHLNERSGEDVWKILAAISSVPYVWSLFKHHGPYSSQLCGQLREAYVEPSNFEFLLSQVLEHEADMVGLKLMALAGYDPIHAPRLHDFFARLEEHERLCPSSSDCSCQSLESVTPWRPGVTMTGSDLSNYYPETTQCWSLISERMETCENEHFKQIAAERWWHSTHPPIRARQQYLTEALFKERKKFEESEKLRTKPVKRFQYSIEGSESGKSGEFRDSSASAKPWMSQLKTIC